MSIPCKNMDTNIPAEKTETGPTLSENGFSEATAIPRPRYTSPTRTLPELPVRKPTDFPGRMQDELRDQPGDYSLPAESD